MNHQNHHRPARKRGGGGGGGDPTTVVQPGQVNFRLLCHVNTAGGVIGNSGTVIKNLEAQTGCKIRFEEPLPNCHERVINITGDSNIDKKIGISYNNSEEVEEVVEVSRAQEGLIRVYERVSQVEGNEGGAIGCRLLAVKSQIGALMGKGGTIVEGIRKSTGAKIKVLKKDQLPACAVPEEELIQIMGRTLAVKKALVSVSRRLQVRLPSERTTAHVTSEGAFHEQSVDFLQDTKPSIPPLQRNAVNDSSVVQSLSSDVDRVLNLDADSAQRKVVFRLLCSNDAAGGVIGKGAIIVKALEKDTGASIKFSTPIAGSKDRVATISSLESREPLYSPAQVATVRVFERSLEVSRVHRHIPGVGKGGSISARILLVGSSEIKCLHDERGRVSSDIGLSTGVEVQLLGAEHAPNCAAENDKVVQV
nr:RNA-binding KH domain-containing protein RCF3-like [Nicotiana tomentosiformis]